MISKNQKIYRLKDEHGHFTSEARVCIMALVGESEVPAHRCGVVIQTVVNKSLGQEFRMGIFHRNIQPSVSATRLML